MRIPGRFWWGEALVACIVAALTVAGPTLYLSSQLSLDSELGLSPTTDLALAIGLLLASLMLTLLIVMSAARSLAHYRLLRRALRGDTEAFPLAVAIVPTGDVPDLTDAPLVLHWRMKRAVLLSKSLNGVLALAQLLGLAIISYVGVRDLIRHSSTLGYLAAHSLPVVLFVAAFIALIILLIALARIGWFQWRHAFGVTATAEGLACIHETGRQMFIPWSDARLFEVEQRGRSALATRVWRLYGSGDVATWRYHQLSRELALDGVSAIEMKLRVDALARLITARTGLPPRTVSKSLIEMPVIASRRLLGFAIFYALAAAFSLALAVVVVAAPLTDTPWLNIAFSLPLVYTAIQLTRTLQRFRQTAARQASHADVSRDPALIVSFEDDATRGSVYALSIGPSRAARARRFLGGALLAVELLPGLQALLSTTAATVSPGAEPTLHFTLSQATLLSFFPLGDILAWTLSVYGLLGLIICFFALYAHGTVIRADDLGLSMTAGTFTVAYPWNEMGEIRENLTGEHVTSYTVYSRAGGIIIGWPATAADLASVAREDGTLPVTPQTLAQLVSQRIGDVQSSQGTPQDGARNSGGAESIL